MLAMRLKMRLGEHLVSRGNAQHGALWQHERQQSAREKHRVRE